jgi:hypothetical protein
MPILLSLLLSRALCEEHPKFTWQRCTSTSCTRVQGYLVADVSFRSSAQSPLLYEDELGVHTDGTSVSQRLVTDYNGRRSIGSRLYLLDSTEKSYQLFDVNNKEIAYDVDLSQIACGVDAALYLTQMSGGDAPFGGGYCDASFPGGMGCPSFDLQHANARAMTFRARPCGHLGPSTDGFCASPGCGYNAYRLGLGDYWGKTINARSKITVVTQFVAAGTALTEIRRIYIQGGRVFRNPAVKVGTREYSALSDEFCRATADDWGGKTWMSLARMGESFGHGHVLVFALADGDDMAWLDSAENGPCGNPTAAEIEAEYPDMKVTWGNLKFGDIDTTY